MGGLLSNFGVNAAKIIENSIAKVGQELKSITVWLVTVGDKLEQIANKLLISVYTLVAVLIGIFSVLVLQFFPGTVMSFLWWCSVLSATFIVTSVFTLQQEKFLRMVPQSVLPPPEKPPVKSGDRIRLQLYKSEKNLVLHSHDHLLKADDNNNNNQRQEVTAFSKRDQGDIWTVTIVTNNNPSSSEILDINVIAIQHQATQNYLSWAENDDPGKTFAIFCPVKGLRKDSEWKADLTENRKTWRYGDPFSLQSIGARDFSGCYLNVKTNSPTALHQDQYVVQGEKEPHGENLLWVALPVPQ